MKPGYPRIGGAVDMYGKRGAGISSAGGGGKRRQTARKSYTMDGDDDAQDLEDEKAAESSGLEAEKDTKATESQEAKMRESKSDIDKNQLHVVEYVLAIGMRTISQSDINSSTAIPSTSAFPEQTTVLHALVQWVGYDLAEDLTWQIAVQGNKMPEMTSKFGASMDQVVQVKVNWKPFFQAKLARSGVCYDEGLGKAREEGQNSPAPHFLFFKGRCTKLTPLLYAD
ncbi:hypothetical protein VTL71DRAFT_9516 [Oculimacula yallundae]|uniref:Uncharacterized protein n=1 Tax=Oculimacula yallundae TaxID=86028 RepID=A0ABR4BS51_9HELO